MLHPEHLCPIYPSQVNDSDAYSSAVFLWSAVRRNVAVFNGFGVHCTEFTAWKRVCAGSQIMSNAWVDLHNTAILFYLSSANKNPRQFRDGREHQDEWKQRQEVISEWMCLVVQLHVCRIWVGHHLSCLGDHAALFSSQKCNGAFMAFIGFVHKGLSSSEIALMAII